jgi:hypothetical protein
MNAILVHGRDLIILFINYLFEAIIWNNMVAPRLNNMWNKNHIFDFNQEKDIIKHPFFNCWCKFVDQLNNVSEWIDKSNSKKYGGSSSTNNMGNLV